MAQIDKAQQIISLYRELVHLARKRGTITYGKVAQKIGVHTRQVGQRLDAIAVHLFMVGLPPLQVLVVNGTSRRPVPGMLCVAETFEEACNRVYDYDGTLTFSTHWVASQRVLQTICRRPWHESTHAAPADYCGH